MKQVNNQLVYHIMTTENKKKTGIGLLTKLSVGTALGVAAFFFLKNEKPTLKSAKSDSNQNKKEELFI